MRVWLIIFIICLLIFTPPINAIGNTNQILKKGFRGAQVQALQETLAQLGYTITVDGIFGEETEPVVKELQTNQGIASDGIVGPKTYQVLTKLIEQSQTHIVQSGDTLYGLALAYGTTVDNIQKVNRLNSTVIRPGQELVIPVIARSVPSKHQAPKFIWPLNGRISSPYGWRIHPIHKTRHFHGGIDIAAATGTIVRAAAAGRVVQAGWMGAFGQAVVIDHGNGYTTWYGHNSQILVRLGDQVSVNQPIAKVGSTGQATGPHLDFRIKYHDQTINPLDLLP